MKIVGMLMIMFSATATGFIRAEKYKTEEDEFKGFIELIKFIKHEISQNLTLQKDIYQKFENEALNKNGFIEILRYFSQNNYPSPLYIALKEYSSELKVNVEAVAPIIEYSEKFGSFSIEEEVARANALIEDLEEIYKSNKDDISNKKRLCRTVGCMVGIGLLLLLW